MSVWQLFTEGSMGALRFGLSAIEVQAEFGEPDNERIEKDGRISILKYGDVELHFGQRGVWLIHSERDHPAAGNAFSSPRLGLTPPEFDQPVTLKDLEAKAKTRGVSTELGDDVLGRLQLKIGFAEIFIDNRTIVVSVADYSLLD